MDFKSSIFGKFSGSILPSPNEINLYQTLKGGFKGNYIGLAVVIVVFFFFVIFTMPARNLDKCDAAKVSR